MQYSRPAFLGSNNGFFLPLYWTGSLQVSGTHGSVSTVLKPYTIVPRDTSLMLLIVNCLSVIHSNNGTISCDLRTLDSGGNEIESFFYHSYIPSFPVNYEYNYLPEYVFALDTPSCRNGNFVNTTKQICGFKLLWQCYYYPGGVFTPSNCAITFPSASYLYKAPV